MTATTWQKRVDSGDWDAITAEVNDFGGALLPRLLTKAEAEKIRRALSRRPPVPLDDRHAPIPVRRGRVPVLRSSRIPSRSRRSRRRCTRGCCRSRRDWWTKLGRDHTVARRPSTTGSTCATRQVRRSRPRSCSSTARATGTRCTGICTASLVFPLQVVINLSEPGVDHTGGEFLLVEQRPRAQSRGTATLLPARPRVRVHHPRAAGAIGTGLVRRHPSGTVCRPSAPASDSRSGLVFHDAA